MSGRKTVFLVLCLVMAFFLCSCDSETDPPAETHTVAPSVPVSETDSPDVLTQAPFEGDVSIVRNTRGENYTAQDGVRILTVTVTVPEIDDANYEIAAAIINDYYQQQQDKHYQYADQELYEYAIYSYTNSTLPSDEFVTHLSEQFFTVEYNSDGYISFFRVITESSSLYSETSVASETFETGGGGLVTLDYMFSCDSETAMERICSEICSQIKAQIEAGETGYYENVLELVPQVVQAGSFYLSEEGLVFYFQTYEIAYEYLPTPVFLIPYEALADIFTLW